MAQRNKNTNTSGYITIVIYDFLSRRLTDEFNVKDTSQTTCFRPKIHFKVADFHS